MRRTLLNVAARRVSVSQAVFAGRTAVTTIRQLATPTPTPTASTAQPQSSPKLKMPKGIDLPVNKEELQQMLTFKDSTVRGILEDKGYRPLVYISEEDTVHDALKRMVKERVGALVIGKVDEQGRFQLTGIFTERDYMKKVFLKGRASPTTKVKEVMTPNPVHVTLDTSASDCMEIITENRFRHLPVCEYDHDRAEKACYPVGLISIGDLVKYVIAEQKQTIDYLNEYIQRSGYE